MHICFDLIHKITKKGSVLQSCDCCPIFDKLDGFTYYIQLSVTVNFDLNLRIGGVGLLRFSKLLLDF